MSSISRHHAEWLWLMDVSGPFLSVSVLAEVLPNGLKSHDSTVAAELRAAHAAWAEAHASGDDAEALHRAFVDFVLERVLGYRHHDLLRDSTRLEADFGTEVTTYDAMLVPDAVLVDGDAARLLVTVSPPSAPVDEPVPGSDWTASPRERMVEMLRGTGCPLGLVTDGERWTLVSQREGEAPGYATWLASLWREEPLTLRAFRTLLGAGRFFSVPDEETLEGLLERSAVGQAEVTTKLGNQTLEAVEILVRTLDRLDRDRGGDLLEDVPEPELYDAAVTVMMRLVFLFFAEENDLLPMNEDLWQEQYAASTLRARLQKMADEHGEQVLETHADAWPRLLATWRAVFGGVEHGDMRLAPYGGSLFDPDRYPFLEGRLPGTSWREDPANPLPVDNRTVLHLLSALQTLREGTQRRRLSFRGLDVEQIGHVYEGMLDHTADRAEGWVLGLSGTGGKEPEIALDELKSLDQDGLVELLKDRTGRGTDMIERWLDADPDEEVRSFGTHWSPAFGGDTEAAERVQRFAKFLREDSFGAPTVFAPGSVYVCDSSHRGATGTHYTPRSFTEEMVRETLDPLVYDGIAEGKPEDEWQLRKPDQILELKVGDPACGSGAFLVQACRYLSAKLVESRRAWGELDHDPTEDDLIHARREVASRCLYGVDVNPMAAEMAKLSLWLVTLERDKPFSFLDHAIGIGDSLVGLTNLDQLRRWDLSGEGDPQEMITGIIGDEVEEALDLRAALESSPALDIRDVEYKQRLLEEAKESTARLRALADLLLAPSIASDKAGEVKKLRDEMLHFATRHLEDQERLAGMADGGVRPFHWVLEFPEVFERGGFDAMIGNPPFMGGSRISGEFGQSYREYLVETLACGTRGNADLVAYFFLRAYALLSKRGVLGLLAVNTVSEGDTRFVGLERILKGGGTVFSTWPNEPWPNEAAVVTTRVHLTSGSWNGRVQIGGRRVPRVSAFLKAGDHWSPKRLIANRQICYAGSKIYGSGFLLDDAEAELYPEGRESDPPVLSRYLTGRDLNQDPGQEGGRWVVNFWDWPQERAATHERLFGIVEERVRPGRETYDHGGHAQRKWWLFERPRAELYHAIGRGGAFEQHPDGWLGSDRLFRHVVVVAQTGKYLSVSMLPNRMVFSHMTIVFASDSFALLALLNSTMHEAWVWHQGSKLKTDLRYIPTDCFETFPLPVHGELPDDALLEDLGERFHKVRRKLMLREDVGLTKLYNRLHDSEDQTDGLDELRGLQVQIDERVLDLYGWDDIKLDHDFRDVPHLPDNDCHRYTISETARLEILDRLGRLNRERYEEEVAAGLHDKKGKKKKASKKKSKPRRKEAGDSQPSLFQEGEGSK